MRYLIDGYNLLFRIEQAIEDFSKQRETIILELNRRIQRLKMDVVVVFDAQYTPEEAHRTHYNHLEIIYSAKGESADDLICKLLRKVNNPANYTIVTSDKKLASDARGLGSKTESVETFIIKLNKRYQKSFNEKKQEDHLPLLEAKKKRETDMDRWLRIFEERFKKGFGA